MRTMAYERATGQRGCEILSRLPCQSRPLSPGAEVARHPSAFGNEEPTPASTSLEEIVRKENSQARSTWLSGWDRTRLRRSSFPDLHNLAETFSNEVQVLLDSKAKGTSSGFQFRE